MPEKRKEKKTRDIIQETKGGAEIFMPSRKRKRTVKYPKGFDPKNPGPEPDGERWLPKWQRSRFKKYAKKKGIYLKGAQGDAQIDTDVTSAGFGQSTAHQEVATDKSSKQAGKRRKK
jgi:signal recognition particle subunit SRP72